MRALLLVSLLAAACSPPPAPPTLRAVTPGEVSREQASEVVIEGDGFLPRVKADLDHPSKASFTPWFAVDLLGPQEASAALVAWTDAQHLTARVPAGLAPGPYDVQVTDAYGRRARLDGGLHVICATCPDAGDDVGPCDGGFRDWDRDGYGENGGWGTACGVPRVQREGDCDDFDALIHADAGEVCNGFDDNCDGVVDEGCTPGLGWKGAQQPYSGSTFDWKVAAVPSPGDAWLVGRDQLGNEALALRDAGAFVQLACPGAWTTGALGPSGTLFLASGAADGGLAHYSPGASGCSLDAPSTAPVAMLRQIPATGGSLLGVTGDALLEWGAAPVFTPLTGLPAGTVLTCLGGVRRDALWLGGRSPGGLEAWVLDGDGGLTAQGLAGLLTSDHLVSVDAFASGDAVAVGDDGQTAMRLAGQWKVGPRLSIGNLAATWAVTPGRVYGVGAGKTVVRFNGHQWIHLGIIPVGTQSNFEALAASSEADLWVVGSPSWVLHWRE